MLSKLWIIPSQSSKYRSLKRIANIESEAARPAIMLQYKLKQSYEEKLLAFGKI